MNSRYVKTSKELLLRTREKTWDTIEPEDQGYCRVQVFGGHRRYYIRLSDLATQRDRIFLYERVYDFPPLIYIAGPYTAADDAGIQANITRAEQTGLECCRLGWAAYIPHKNFAGFHVHADFSYDDWIGKDLAFLAKSDAILLLEGWASSKGASQEFRFAEERGIHHFFARDGMPRPDAVRRVV
jgi:hypothetical protein